MIFELIKGNCQDIMPSILKKFKNRYICIVTDPPFNVGYHYNTYKDNMDEYEYYHWLKTILGNVPKVVIHYPESLHRLSIELNEIPDRVISWVYNSNTPRQHRDIAFYGIKPDFSKVKQPYKNLNDKRIQKRIKKGLIGANIYDWWNINQIKNVSKEDKYLNHPCIMPIQVLINIIGLLPEDTIIIDPFLGSGTTGLACQILNRDFIGIEIDPDYYDMAKGRLTDSYEKIQSDNKTKSLENWGIL